MFLRRARTSKGRYKADDKSTFFNEAWVIKPSPQLIKKFKKNKKLRFRGKKQKKLPWHAINYAKSPLLNNSVTIMLKICWTYVKMS